MHMNENLLSNIERKTCILYELAHLQKTIISCMLQQAECIRLNTICQFFKYQVCIMMYKNNNYADVCM